MGSMNRFMASGRPAATLLNESKARVVDSADHDRIAALLSEMTLQTEVCVTDLQHLVVHTAMGIMAGRTSIPHGLMLKGIRARLGRMALRTGGQLRCADSIRHKGGIIVPVGIMTINTGHFPVVHRMAVRQGKLTLHIKVTLETGVGTALRIVDEVAAPTLHGVQTSRTVTGFTTQIEAVFFVNHQPCMGRIGEVAPDVLMT